MTEREARSLASVLVPHIKAAIARAVADAQRDYELALLKATTSLRERLVGVEARPPVPGPIGPPGRDGTDGLGFDDLSVLYDGERTFTWRFMRGTATKDFTFKVPFPLNRGPWEEARVYERGDMVRHGHSIWYCTATETTKRMGDGSADWFLWMKRP